MTPIEKNSRMYCWQRNPKEEAAAAAACSTDEADEGGSLKNSTSYQIIVYGVGFKELPNPFVPQNKSQQPIAKGILLNLDISCPFLFLPYIKERKSSERKEGLAAI